MKVVDLKDKSGKVVGYATGTDLETAAMAQSVWTPATGVVVGTALDALKAAVVTRIQDLRRAAEAAGVLVNGDVFATDIGSQVKYVAALVHAMRNPGFTTQWKTDSGYVNLDVAGISTVSQVVLAYVQMCFAWEQSKLAAVDACPTIDAVQAIDLNAGRPSGVLPPELFPAVSYFGPTALQGTSLDVSGVSTLAKVSASELSVSGACALGVVSASRVTVTGATTLAAATATGLTVNGAARVTGAATLGSLTSGSSTVASLITAGTVTARKIKGNSAAPALVRGAGSGSTSVVTMAPGSTDTAGQISVAAAGAVNNMPGTVIVTVTFTSAYPSAPFVVTSPASILTGGLMQQPFVTATTTGFALSISGTGYIYAGNTYLWNYHVIQ